MSAALAKAKFRKPKTSVSAAFAKVISNKPKTSVFDKLPAPAGKSSSGIGASVKLAEKKEEPLAGFGNLPPSTVVRRAESEEKPSSTGLSLSQFVLSDHSYALSDTSEAASSKDVTPDIRTLTNPCLSIFLDLSESPPRKFNRGC